MTLTPTFQPPGRLVPLEELFPTGDCPECGGIGIPLYGRRKVGPHGQHVRRGDRVVESDTPCDGAGGPTAEDLEVPSRRQQTKNQPTA